jgi:rare lipoprotein A
LFYKLEQIVYCGLSIFLATGCSLKDSQESSYEYTKLVNNGADIYKSTTNSQIKKIAPKKNIIKPIAKKISSQSNAMSSETLSLNDASNQPQARSVGNDNITKIVPATASNGTDTKYIYENNKHTVKPYTVLGKSYTPMDKVKVGYKQYGLASWYGSKFNNKKTSSGEIYDMYKHTAAHKTLPMGTYVKVTSKNNNQSTIVRINDRGPFVDGRIIDLSYVAGKRLGIDKTGTTPVVLEVLDKKQNNNKLTQEESQDKKLVSISSSDTKSPLFGVSSGYYVQVGAFTKLQGAKIYQKKYLYLGNSVYIKKHDMKDGRVFYKVLIGDLKSYQEATSFKRKNKMEKSFIYRVF